MKEKLKILISALFLVAGILTSHDIIPLADLFSISETAAGNIELIIFLAAYLIAGGSVIKEAVENIFGGDIFNENFLMTVASLGAFIIGEHAEGVAVMILYQIGEYFQSYAVGKSRRSIAELMDIRPDEAFKVLNDGNIVKVNPQDVKIGEIIVVKPGNKIPLDGKVAKGSAMLDTSALTGESVPRQVNTGETVLSGSICMDSTLEIEVEKEFGQSTVSKILELVENASNAKADSEKFITKFARYYTPIVCLTALLTAVIPILTFDRGNIQWIYRALNFLVISCPCALVISVPLSFFAGLGGASSKGVLIKGSNYLEMLSSCDTIVFDKTGTLTKGTFKVTKLCPTEGYNQNQLLEICAIAEINSNHPIADSLKEAYTESSDEAKAFFDSLQISSTDIEIKEISGKGVVANYRGNVYVVGNSRLMSDYNISCSNDTDITGTIVHAACNDDYMGYIVISDEIKATSKDTITELNNSGINTIMLTGDKKIIAEKVAEEIGIKEVKSELLPTDKAEFVENYLKENSSHTVAFVGDGINDAPVLALAHIGIAMGALGSDAAIEAADIVLMNDNPKDIITAIKIAKKTVKIVKENIIFSLAVKFLIMILSIVGIANMWYAVFADVGVCIIAIINAMRTSRL